MRLLTLGRFRALELGGVNDLLPTPRMWIDTWSNASDSVFDDFLPIKPQVCE